MHGRAVCVAVLVLLAVALAPPLAAAQPWAACDRGSGNYSAGSTYEKNLVQLIPDLRGNAYSSPDLFASGSAGAGAGSTVYGLLLCRGDISANDCYDCGTSAARDVQSFCNHTRDVALCYNQCYFRVSDTDFLASANNSGLVPLYSSANVSSGVDVTAYNRAVTALLNATARYAVETSTRLFATGQLVGLDPNTFNLSSTAQCTPDLSPASCRRCFDDLVAIWWQTFRLNVLGARIAGSQCSLRSETESPFYTGKVMVNLQLKGGVISQAPANMTPVPAPAPSRDFVPGTTEGGLF